MAEEVAQMGSWRWDLRTQKVTWSDQMFRLFGVEREGFDGDVNRVVSERIHPDDRELVSKSNHSVLENDRPIPLSYRIALPDGTVRTVWAQGKLIRNEAGQPIALTGYVQDITERVQAEKKILQMKRLYATLSQVNQTIVRIKNRADLYQSICDIAVKFGDFALAWIGLLDEQSGDVNPVAASGAELSNWNLPKVNISNAEYRHGLTAEAIRSGRVVTDEDLQAGKQPTPLRQRLYELGYRSVAGVPFSLQSKAIGVLALVSREAGLFKSEDELRLLDEMGLDISFALDTMESEKIKRQWADAFEHCAHGIAIGLPSSNIILTCNPAFARLQGRAVEEVSSMPILAQYAPQEHERIKQQISLADRSGRAQYETHMIRKDGSAYPVQIDLVSVRNEEGNLLYRVATQQDISERKEAELALQRSERLLRLFIERAPAAIAMFDLEMRYIIASRRYLSDYKLSDQDLTGRSHYEVFPEITEHWKEIHRRCLAGAIERAEEDPFPRVDGSLDWVRWEIHPWYEDTGKIGGVILFSEVITEQKLAREALRESEERYRSLLDVAPVAIAVHVEEKIAFINPAGARLLGAENESQLIGKPITEIIHPDGLEKVKARIPKMLAGEQGLYPAEDVYLRLDGSPIQVEVTATLLQYQGKPAVQAIVADITGRKRAEAERRNFYETLNASLNELYIFDAETLRFEFVSSGALRNLGYALDEMRGMTPLDLKPKFTAANFDNLIAPLRRYEAQVVNFETLHRRADGSLYPIEAHLQLLEQGGREVFLAVILDITERKRAEEALRESESIFLKVFQSSPIGINILRLSDGRSTNINDAFLEIIGYAREEVIGHSAAELNLFIDIEMHEMLTKTLREGRIIQNQDAQIRSKCGEIKTVLASLDTIEINGELMALVFAADITERNKAEEALRAADEKYRNIFENAVEAITQTTCDGNYLSANPATARILGYDSTEELISGVSDLNRQFYVKPGRREEFQKLLQEHGSISDFESEVYRKDGSRIWISENSHAVYDKQGNFLHYEGSGQDITRRKQAEKQVEVQMRRMQALNEIDRAISSSLDMRLALDILLDQARFQLGVDAAAVLLLNLSRQTLEYEAGKGFRSLAISQSQTLLGRGLAGKAGMERRLLHIPDLAAAGEEFQRRELLRGEEFVEYFAVPLIAKGMLKGVLEVFHRSPIHPDMDWVNYLETLGGQAAIAIDNAQLFEGMQRSNLELITAYDATIEGWSRAMDLRDKETEGHTQRVSELTARLAKNMGISQREITQMRRGALLHDIGKLGIPDHILHKPDKLDRLEWAIMRQHPSYAFNMLLPIHYLRPALDIPYCHHEKWDGSGYPRGLKENEIPLAARIFAVVDVWDALRSDRPYRKAWDAEKVRALIRNETGKHFDPQVAAAFLELLDEDHSLE